MKRLVEFPSESGAPIMVEVEDSKLASGTTRRGLSSSAVVERAQTSIEDALEKAQPMAQGWSVSCGASLIRPTRCK